MVLVYTTENGNTSFIEIGTHLYNKKNLTKYCTTEYHNKFKNCGSVEQCIVRVVKLKTVKCFFLKWRC